MLRHSCACDWVCRSKSMCGTVISWIHYCVDSGSKWHSWRKMSTVISEIFWLQPHLISTRGGVVLSEANGIFMLSTKSRSHWSETFPTIVWKGVVIPFACCPLHIHLKHFPTEMCLCRNLCFCNAAMLFQCITFHVVGFWNDILPLWVSSPLCF